MTAACSPKIPLPSPGAVLVFGAAEVNEDPSPTGTQFLVPGFTPGMAALVPIEVPSPIRGTARALYVHQLPFISGTDSLTYTVLKNGQDLGLRVNIQANVASAHNVQDEFDVEMGDLLSVRVEKVSGGLPQPANIVVAFAIRPR